MDFISYQITRGIYFIVLLIPFSILGMVGGELEVAPVWVTFPIVIIGLIYVLYASAWATRSAKMISFEGKSFLAALHEGRTQLNFDIRIWASFMPIFGSLFGNKKNPPTPTFEEWKTKRNQDPK